MDAAAGSDAYQDTLTRLQAWIEQPELTLSAQLLEAVRENNGIGSVGQNLAASHAASLNERQYQFYSSDMFEQEAAESVERQKQIEGSDELSFDAFLDAYFADIK